MLNDSEVYTMYIYIQGGAKVLLQNFMSILVLINLTKKLN